MDCWPLALPRLPFSASFSLNSDARRWRPGGELWRLASVVGVFVIVENIDGFLLTPRILGGRLQLHPMAVFLGLLLAGICSAYSASARRAHDAVGKVFAKFLRESYLQSSFYRRGSPHLERRDNATLQEKLEGAADVVLEKQGRASRGDELLAPNLAEDDPAATG